MVQRLKDDLLHQRTKHTNLPAPYCKYISYNKYPEQNKSVLGSRIKLQYRNQNIIKPPLDIPAEDIGNDLETDDFLVIRCDNEEPYVMVAVEIGYRLLLVLDSRTYQSTNYPIYPTQMSEYIGLELSDQYLVSDVNKDELPNTCLKGITVRVDNGEPCQTIIAEEYIDNSIKIVLGDECQSLILGHYIEDDSSTLEYPRYKSGAEIEVVIRKALEGKKIYGID